MSKRDSEVKRAWGLLLVLILEGLVPKKGLGGEKETHWGGQAELLFCRLGLGGTHPYLSLVKSFITGRGSSGNLVDPMLDEVMIEGMCMINHLDLMIESSLD